MIRGRLHVQGVSGSPDCHLVTALAIGWNGGPLLAIAADELLRYSIGSVE